MLDLEDGCGIRSHRIAHPDPHESIAGNGRVAAYLCNPRDVFRARDTRASAAEVINQPVVAAFDLIINKPTKLRMAEAFPDDPVARNVKEPIYLGGPQLLPAVFAVVRTAPEGNGTIVPLMPGLVAIIDGESVDRVIATTPNEARYFAGLMVWDDEDLYAQVKAQLWEVRPADVEAVFRAKAIGLWNALRGPTASLPDGLLPKQFG